MVCFIFGCKFVKLSNMMNFKIFSFMTFWILTSIVVSFFYPFSYGRPFSPIWIWMTITCISAVFIIWIIYSTLNVTGTRAISSFFMKRDYRKRFSASFTANNCPVYSCTTPTYIGTISRCISSWMKFLTTQFTFSIFTIKRFTANITTTIIFICYGLSDVKGFFADNACLCDPFALSFWKRFSTIRAYCTSHLFSIIGRYPAFVIADRTDNKNTLSVSAVHKSFFTCNILNSHIYSISGIAE